MARLDVLRSAVEDAPADGLLDKLREVAFFHARGAEISAQRKVDFPGDLDISTGRSSLLRSFALIYAYRCLSVCVNRCLMEDVFDVISRSTGNSTIGCQHILG